MSAWPGGERASNGGQAGGELCGRGCGVGLNWCTTSIPMHVTLGFRMAIIQTTCPSPWPMSMNTSPDANAILSLSSRTTPGSTM
jgi:hypothetical protein